jgi:hypothetical protein
MSFLFTYSLKAKKSILLVTSFISFVFKFFVYSYKFEKILFKLEFFLDLLKKFLNVLPPLTNNNNDINMQQLTEFRVDEVYFKKKPGHILAGMLMKGTIQEQEKLLLGPFELGEFIPIEVQTAQRYKGFK